MTSPVLSAYGTQSREYDRKEAMPIPLALIVSWEELLCTQSTALTTKLFLGAALLCTHAGLRFGDAQRVDWWTLQLSAQGLHGTAYATKTTTCGQPFACTWHGLAGRGVQSSWLLHWLACLVQIGEHASIAPDFLFFHCDLESQQLPHTFPSSYSQALLCLRYMAQQAGLTAEEALSLTLHSMKSTLLAAGAQLHFAEQSRLAQGHHRDSLRLYSRNDTLEALRLQKELTAQLAGGWRPQRSMARGGAAPVPEPHFRVPPVPPPHLLAPSDLLSGPWQAFTSRHESMHAAEDRGKQPAENAAAPLEAPTKRKAHRRTLRRTWLNNTHSSMRRAPTRNLLTCRARHRRRSFSYAPGPGMPCIAQLEAHAWSSRSCMAPTRSTHLSWCQPAEQTWGSVQS